MSDIRRICASRLIAPFLACVLWPPQTSIALAGTFTLETVTSRHIVPNTNTGLARQTLVQVKVLYNGRPVTIPDAKKDAQELLFWEAWTLPTAPRPAVLAMNRASYLITEDNGVARVQMLRGSFHDAASWQWLDAGDIVGERHSVYMLDAVKGPRELRGGTMLAISGRALLNVKTLQVTELDLEGNSQKLVQTQGYATNAPDIILYSSKAGQVAVLGRNHAETFGVGSTANPPFAMLVTDLVSGDAYAVPFDRQAARLVDPDLHATAQWASNNFEWRADAKDAKGRQRLQWRKRDRPLPWMGYLVKPQTNANFTADTVFELVPTDRRMVAPLLRMIEREFGGRQISAEAGSHTDAAARFEVNGQPIMMALRSLTDEETEQHALYLAADVPVHFVGSRPKYEPEKIQAANRMVMQLGELINARLSRGELQEFFTAMPEPR